MIRITIVYDNTAYRNDLKGDWGFSALVEAFGRRVLFDTGAKGDILLEHMEKLAIDPASIDDVVISHDHWDHTGGLEAILEAKPVRVYIPHSASGPKGAAEVVRVKDPVLIFEPGKGSGVPVGMGEKMLESHIGKDGIYSTGELSEIEQSLVVVEGGRSVVVVGCSHSGVGNILTAAGRFADVRALVGGLHGFDEFERLMSLEKVVPTHCTQFRSRIKSLYPDKYVEGGAGRVLEF